jgi:uncharacterized protein YqeY
MSLKETIKKDFVEAFRNKNLDKKGVLSMVNSEIKNAEIEFGNREEGLSDEQVLDVIKKGVKQRRDAIEKYKAGDRVDLVEKEQKELDILKEYLPEELSPEKIEEVVKAVIEKTGAQDISSMGAVMGATMKELKGQADGNLVREIVAKLLNG